MSDPKLDALHRIPLFARCSQGTLRVVAANTDEVNVQAERTLVRQGQPSDAFYVLLAGQADVIVDGERRRSLAAGDFFGEISMLDRGPATATVTTTTPAHMMVMSHGQFREAIKSNEELLTQVMAAVAERLRADWMERLNQG